MKIDIGRKQYSDFGATTALGADLRTWLRIIFTFRKEVDWQFWPKTIVIGLFILMNTPVIWYEKLRYGRRIRNTVVKAPVFIIGHQRSGTTYLHYLLSKDPQFAFCSVKESFMPWTFFTLESFLMRIYRKVLPEKRPMDDLKLGTELPTETEYPLGNMGLASMVPGYYFPRKMYAIFRRYVLFDREADKHEWQRTMKYYMQKLTLKHGDRPLVMKSPENLGRVKAILEVFPDARFIHIYRNPYTVYFSTERLYEITLPMVALQHCDAQHVQDFILHSYPDMFARFFADKASMPAGSLAEMSYEAFIGNELEVLRQVYKTLGLQGFEQALPHIAQEIKGYEGYRTNRYDYPEQRKQEVYAAWKEVFLQLGYAK
jgi:hypothetical protein